MKKLLIESGATKAEWAYLDGDQVQRSTSKGWNATSSTEDLAIDDTKRAWIEAADRIYFFGAGVSSPYAQDRVKSQFGLHKNTIAESDLKAACIATLGQDYGIAGILGTGSISCIWDGSKANVVIPSLGYLLSDEGSGSDIGREVLRAYFYGKMPQELKEKFDEQYQLTTAIALDQLYNQGSSKSYLAQFSKFITAHPHEWSGQLVKGCLQNYFDIRIQPIFNKKVEKLGFVGSIAFVFKDYLIEICSALKIDQITIYPSAVEGIIKYHQTYEQ